MGVCDNIYIKIRIKLEGVASHQKHFKKSPDYDYASQCVEDAVDGHLFLDRI